MSNINDVKIINTKTGQRQEPNMVVESKEEVIDTIAKKDFNKESLNQNKCAGCPRNMLFKIKKGDPIQVIKTTNIGNLQTDVFYELRKHNGQNFAKTKEEKNKIAVSKSNQGLFAGLPPFNMYGAFSEYNLPKDVVEEPTIIEKVKDIVSSDSNEKNSTQKDNKNLINIALLGLVGFIIYKIIKK